MFWRKNPKTDWDLERLSDEDLANLSLPELQRILNKRWAHGLEELQKRAEDELKRRDPRTNWSCVRCGKTRFYEKEIRVAGGFGESFLNWQRHKYHAIVCNYCGKTEFYSALMSGAEQGIDFIGG